MVDTVQLYNDQRAERLARLVLTHRGDVRLLHFGEPDDANMDLIAHILKPIEGSSATPYFGVAVKGTSKLLKDEKAANKLANLMDSSIKPTPFLLAPVILLLFSVERDRGYWGWIKKPVVGGTKGPTLIQMERIEMKPINKDTLELLFSSVIAWFQALGKVLHESSEES